MSEEEQTEALQELQDAVQSEGFDYAFRYYSHFEEVEDKQFHRLREKYLAARSELESYLTDDLGLELES